MPKIIPSCFSACFAHLTGAEKRVVFSNPKYNDPSTVDDDDTPRRRRRRQSSATGLIKKKNSSQRRKKNTEKVDEDKTESRPSDDYPRETESISGEAQEERRRSSSKERRRSSGSRTSKQIDEDKQNSGSTQTDRSLNIIIFGATGALGSYTVMHAVNVLSKFKWGIAGRNQKNLEMVLRNVGSLTDKKCDDIPITIADANNKEELAKMTRSCQLLINCCGPYEKTARNVIDSCIATATHYVDASAEPYFLNQMRCEFHTSAEAEKVYILTSCGFLSFVVDVGINFIERHFIGYVNTVEAYTQYCSMSSRQFVPLISCSTWRIFIGAMCNAKQLMAGCKKKTGPSAVNTCGACLCSAINKYKPEVPKFSCRWPIGQTDAVNGVSIPQPFIDAQVVKTSQEIICKEETKQPLHFRSYLTFSTYFQAFLALIWWIVLFVLAQAPGTRNLLVRYPTVFSLGTCANRCIEKQIVDELMFAITFKATGYGKSRRSTVDDSQLIEVSGPSPHCKPLHPSVPAKVEEEKTLKVKICAGNPFYNIGCVALLSSGITVLNETENLPGKGGVFTPGAAFRNTKILQEVTKHNPRFKYKLQ